MPTGDNALIKMLTQKPRDDAGVAGFTLTDLELEEAQVEQFIRETLTHVGEPTARGK